MYDSVYGAIHDDFVTFQSHILETHFDLNVALFFNFSIDLFLSFL